MKFKFGDKVVIAVPGFYNGAEGVITYYFKNDDKYNVQLAYNVVREFTTAELKLRGRRKNEQL